MQNALLRKLSHFGPLPDDDCDLLGQVVKGARLIDAKQDIIRQGDRPDAVHLVLQGFACRYKLLPDGTRQIVAYLLPGDFSDLHVSAVRQMDHSIATLSACSVVDIPRATIQAMLARPRLAQALWWATLVEQAVLREWLVNIGRRPAVQRIAHMMCELSVRLQAVGLGGEAGYTLPVTQAELADSIGLTAVHVNRALQSLRQEGLIQLKGSALVIPAYEALEAFCDFSPAYLHLLHSGRSLAVA